MTDPLKFESSMFIVWHLPLILRRVREAHSWEDVVNYLMQWKSQSGVARINEVVAV